MLSRATNKLKQVLGYQPFNILMNILIIFHNKYQLITRIDNNVTVQFSIIFSQFINNKIKKMSKWNKSNKQQFSEEFLQNEERRKQMIIEAAKRRREKQRKLQQLNEQLKKKQQKALELHKKQKKDAYVKYLRNNMHDKYENLKHKSKLNQQTLKEVKNVSKWKRKNKEETNNLEGLGLQVNIEPSYLKNQSAQKPKINEKKKMLIEEFEKEWNYEGDDDELIGSKLIDSLDLDIATVQRGREYNKIIKEAQNQSEQVSEVRDLIGYESILFSIDERKEKDTKEQKKKSKQKQKEKKQTSKEQKKIKNQQEAFNELKNKKQGKLLNWANQQVQQADDLFSNCSSKRSMTLKAINQELKKEKLLRKVLDPIPEKKNPTEKVKSNVPSQNKNPNQARSRERRSSTQKRINATVGQRPKPKAQKSVQKPKNNSLQKKNMTRVRQTTNNLSKQKSKSQQKLKKLYIPEKIEKQVPKTQQHFAKKPNPPLPVQPNYTVATHEQHFEIESFIKNDLQNINVEERKLQEEIKKIHLQNKQQIKQVEEKHEIRTNYKTTKNLIKNHQGEQNESQVTSYAVNYKQVNEDDLEDSIQRLDDLLIRKDIESRQRPITHITQQSHSLLESQNSIIDPFSRPADFQNQILKLAQNISRFEKEPEKKEANGYGQKNLMKKKKNGYIPEQILSQSKNVEEISNKYKRQSNVESIGSKMPRPPILQYSAKNEQIQQMAYQNHQQEQFEDSLDTMAKEKIQVNEKLKNLLFD